MSFSQFQGNVQTKIGDVVAAIFPDSTARGTFEGYLNAYKQWSYLVSRDWETTTRDRKSTRLNSSHS
jgi:hypothetical protein